MNRTMLNAKIQRATVTDCDLHYVGSITVDAELLAAADILEFEQVSVVDVDDANQIIAIDSDVATLMAAPAA